MKEFTIEQKAKAYDEVFKKAKEMYASVEGMKEGDVLEEIFPEFKECKGEKIRKALLEMVHDTTGDSLRVDYGVHKEDAIAWLEKQVSQDNAEDADILHRFSFYSYKDEPNVLYLSGFYVNEEYRNKGIGTKILEVADEVAKSLGCNAIRLKTKKNSDAERLYQTHGYNSLSTEGKDDIWLEKLGEQNPYKIEPKFKQGDTIREKETCNLFYVKSIEDFGYTLHYSNCPTKGCTMSFKYEDFYELVEHNPADEVEPKFKVKKGEWYVCTNTFVSKGKIIAIKGQTYQSQQKDDTITCEDKCLFIDRHDGKASDYFRLWTIQDAKDGDVLATDDGVCIFDGTLEEGKYPFAYCGITIRGFESYNRNLPFSHDNNIHPATKEQRDILEKAMTDAGYVFDFEKKELKNIGECNGEDFGIDSLWHAQNILERTLGKVDGYQSDDGILEHKCAINAVKKLYKQKPAECNNSILKDKLLELFQRFRWYCKDEIPTNGDIIEYVDAHIQELLDTIQKPAEWSEKEQQIIKDAASFILSCVNTAETKKDEERLEELAGKLQDLRPNRWKPSDEQMRALDIAIRCGIQLGSLEEIALRSLSEQLKQL